MALQRTPRDSRRLKSSPERQELLRQREAARSRIAQERASVRNRRVRGSHRSKDKPLLDPHGLYGTRTAQRMRAAKRRQWLQKVLLVALFCAFVAWVWTKWHQPRVDTFSLTQAFVGGEISSLVARDGDSAFWVENSGALRVLDARNGQTKRLAQLDFSSRAAPLIAGNLIIIAGEAGVLRALNGSDGRAVWNRKIGRSCSASPLFRVLDVGEKSQKSVIAVSDDGVVCALKAVDGSVIWRTDLRATIGNGMTTVNNLLWIPLGAAQNSRGGLAQLDLNSGRILKTLDLNAAHIAALTTGDAPQNQSKIVSASDNGALFCYDASNATANSATANSATANSATAKRLWKNFARPLRYSSTKSDAESAVVLRGAPLFKTYSWGERIFIGAGDGALRAFDAKSGRELWSRAFDAPISMRPLAWRVATPDGARDFLVCASADASNGELRVLDAQSGEEKWRIDNDSPSRGVFIIGDALWNIAQNGTARKYQLP